MELKRKKKRKRDDAENAEQVAVVPCPFESNLLLFTSYKVRGAHCVAATVLKHMGVEDIHLMEHGKQILTKRKWRGWAVPKIKLFENDWDGGGCEDDGYLKALKATMDEVPADWEQVRVRVRDENLAGFDDKIKQLSRRWFEAGGG